MQGFVNDVDPITLEQYNDIPIENVIRLSVGNKLRFYNVRALYEWVNINPVDPTTKLTFSVHQIRKIRKIYEKSVEQHIYNCIKDFVKKNPFLEILEFEIPKNIDIIKTKTVNGLASLDNIDLSLITNIDRDDCKMIGDTLGMNPSDVKNMVGFVKMQIDKNPELWENLFQSLIKNN